MYAEGGKGMGWTGARCEILPWQGKGEDMLKDIYLHTHTPPPQKLSNLLVGLIR